MVTGGDDACHDNCVNEGASHRTSSHHEDDGERRCVAILLRQALVGVRYVQSDYEDREDVEDQNPPEDVPDNPRKNLRRVFSLSCRNGDGLCATVGKRCCDEDRGESADAANERCIANVPVSAADIFACGVTAAIYSNAEYDKDLDLM